VQLHNLMAKWGSLNDYQRGLAVGGMSIFTILDNIEKVASEYVDNEKKRSISLQKKKEDPLYKLLSGSLDT